MAIKTTFLGHGTFQFEVGGKTVVIDPFFTGNPAASISADDCVPDAIIVSHGHGDHWAIPSTLPSERGRW
jgi:L-ascorbate metabolism protein UlaG (beta-lactamase superfamily)